MRQVFIACVLCTASALAGQDMTAELTEPDGLGWEAVQLGASKLFMSADAGIRIESLETRQLDTPLLMPGEGIPIQPGDRLVAMDYSTTALGRHTQVELLIDAASGAAIQRTSTDSGNKQRYRVYRFTESGAWHHTRWPTDRETELTPDSWTERSEGLRAYPIPTAGEPVADSTGLIYVAAAGALDKPGDRLKILTYARRHLHLVTMEVAPTKPVKVDYRRTDASGTSRLKATIEPIRILIDSEPVGEDADDDEFDMLGLKGDIELLLDPETRLPVQLSGNAKVVGRINFRATSAVLR